MEFLIAAIPGLTVTVAILLSRHVRRRRILRCERKARLLILALR